MNTDGCLTLRYQDSVCDLGGFHASRDGSESEDISQCFLNEGMNCQALVPNPKPISPQSIQTQSQPSPTQFETQINPKGTGADTKIL